MLPGPHLDWELAKDTKIIHSLWILNKGLLFVRGVSEVKARH
jgi:hypothetical protein